MSFVSFYEWRHGAGSIPAAVHRLLPIWKYSLRENNWFQWSNLLWVLGKFLVRWLQGGKSRGVFILNGRAQVVNWTATNFILSLRLLRVVLRLQSAGNLLMSRDGSCSLLSLAFTKFILLYFLQSHSLYIRGKSIWFLRSHGEVLFLGRTSTRIGGALRDYYGCVDFWIVALNFFNLILRLMSVDLRFIWSRLVDSFLECESLPSDFWNRLLF